MRTLFKLLVVLSFASTINVAAQTIPPVSNLEPFEWQNRIVLIHANKKCQEITQQLNAEKAHILERHVLWFLLCERDEKAVLYSNYMNQVTASFFNNVNRHYFASGKANVVLIGKDGGVKYQSKTLVLTEVFNRIDSMPMRQAEMLEQ